MCQNIPGMNIPQLEEDASIYAKEKGYTFCSVKGQHKFGPPINETYIPPRGSEVFVGRLPKDATEREIEPIFSLPGRIYQLRLMMDYNGQNRGFCFVKYYNPEVASKAVTKLNNYEIRVGQTLGVMISVDNRRLFVGGIPKNATVPEVERDMRKLTGGVVRVIMYPTVEDKSKNRGFAFVEYEDHTAAALARRVLLAKNVLVCGAAVAIDWAEPENVVTVDVMSKVMSLYTMMPRVVNLKEIVKLISSNCVASNLPGNRKRHSGAAGMRGLGALTEQFQSLHVGNPGIRSPIVRYHWPHPQMSMPHQSTPELDFLPRTPGRSWSNILSEVARRGNMGEPQYQLMSVPSQEAESDSQTP
ncbi:unnamed protein product [Cyprideis torosa]|uniref:Uncharacterized protein n=1 Tax=Cyprideis torosa TaxID=163714 RepID=A0A7R8W5G6_9CRUS|nr:unnamed protein product [Cyprideis torosa]CAG0884278.1 unnamed protein product [Cyprideis torosa]